MAADVVDDRESWAVDSDLAAEIGFGYPWLHELLMRASGLDLDDAQLAFVAGVADRKLTDLFEVAEQTALANGRERILHQDLPLTKGLRRTIEETAALAKELAVDPALVFKTRVSPNMMVDDMLRAELPRLTAALLVLTGRIVAALEPANLPDNERDRLQVPTASRRPSLRELQRAERVLALTL